MPVNWTKTFGRLAIATMLAAPASTATADAYKGWYLYYEPDAYFHPASASVSALNTSSSQRGRTAVASAEGSREDLRVQNLRNGGYYYSGGSGEGRAEATGNASDLLKVSSHVRVGSPGSGVGAGPGATVDAKASWNDTVFITKPEGGTVPDSVRMDFTLRFGTDYTDTPWIGNGQVIAQVAGKTITIGHSFNPADFDSVTEVGGPGSRSYIGNFHADVKIHPPSTDNPGGLNFDRGGFNVILEATSSGSPRSNTNTDAGHAASLSLTGVSFADGTPIGSKAGYDYGFLSGMRTPLDPSPAPVPEPASVALWSVVAVAAGWAALRRGRA